MPLLVFVCPITSGWHRLFFSFFFLKGTCIVVSEGLHSPHPPTPPTHLHTGAHTLPSPPTPFHVAALCHLGLSIKNVLSPESGPIKGRIPGRRADKAYLINKSFTIVGARAPCHTLPASLWYLIIHPFHSVREGGEGQLSVSSQPNGATAAALQDVGKGAALKNTRAGFQCECTSSRTCKQIQMRGCC